MLAVAGGLGFWLANLAISLTPIAAAYRHALAISYVPMLLEAALGGLAIGFCLGYAMLRFPPRTPTTSPLTRSLMLSLVALIVVTALIEVPAKFFATRSDPLRWFVIGTLFNGLRILALGVVIGLRYDKVASSRGRVT